jgi:hypothetical protein
MMDFAYEISLSYSQSSLTCRENLRQRADSFTCRPKGGMLRIFIALKNLSVRPGFEPANFVSSGKHANQYTTEVTWCMLDTSLLKWSIDG